MSYMQVKTPFMELYEKLSEIYINEDTNSLKNTILSESAVPKYTSELINLNTCREVVTTKYNKIQGGYETNCVTIVDGQLSRVEVRTFVLKKENGEIKFLGRKCNRGKGYTTPGGGFDIPDKTPIETAKRELREELNITLTNIQESSFHSFYSLPRASFTKKYVEQPEDRWTGYYQYYVTAEYAGYSDNDTPEEYGKFKWIPISVFEDPSDPAGSLMLQIINEHKWANNAVSNTTSNTNDSVLDETFNDVRVYGEAAYTENGVLRYFADSLDTLLTILETQQIKMSVILEADPNKPIGGGQKRTLYKKRPFVSFSHQLYSHAYRAYRWRYGVALDENKLLQKIPNHEDNVSDNFWHASKGIFVYGAAKLRDGTDVLITSYGDFPMNLNQNTRLLLKQYAGVDLDENNFYDQVKNVFYNIATKECFEDLEKVKKAMRSRTKSDAIDGFVTNIGLQSYGIRLIALDKQVPGLLTYLQEYTYLDEGELRVWTDWIKNSEYLDISDCIIGVVLPSDFVENNLKNLEDTSKSTQLLRDFISKLNLRTYVYSAENTPKKGTRGKQAKISSINKIDIRVYFTEITRSSETILNFVEEKLHPLAVEMQKSGKKFDMWRLYNTIMTTETTAELADLRKDTDYCLNSFYAEAAERGLSQKTLRYFTKNGVSAQFDTSSEE